jgi:hypothetical protein
LELHNFADCQNVNIQIADSKNANFEKSNLN